MGCIYRILAIVLVFNVISCSSTRDGRGPIVDITSEQVKSSNDTGLLRSLQVTLRSALVDKDAEDYPTEFSLLTDIDTRLANLVKERAVKVMDGKRIVVEDGAESVIPLPDLAKVTAQVKGDESLTPELLTSVMDPIKAEEQLTKKQINKYIEESNKKKLGPTRRAEVYHFIYLLGADDHWKGVRDKQMDVILEPVRNAAAKGSYSKKLEKRVDFIRRIYRTRPRAIVTEMLGIYATIYANRYFYKVNRDDLKGAHEVIVDLSNKPDFNLIIEKLKDHKSKMMTTFAQKVDARLANPDRQGQSYESLLMLSDMNRILNAKFDTDNRSRILANQLFDTFHQLSDQGNHPAALGVLYAIYNIQPNFRNIIGEITAEEAIIYKTAIARLSVKNLYARKATPHAKKIAKSVESYLRGAVPFDVVVTDTADTATLTGSVAKAQPLEIAGNILQIKVEATRKPIKKTLEVTTGQNSIPNPDFFAWMDLPSKQRRSIEKPAETIMVDRRENVSIGGQLHRKTGTFAASFRLIDGSSKDIVFADSITLQREYQDESNTVFEVGDVVIPAKDADLPEDKEVIAEMAKEMATKMGKKLEEKLQDRDLLYINQADKAAKQKQCSVEVDALAKAMAIARAKGKDIEPLSERLRNRAVACLYSASPVPEEEFPEEEEEDEDDFEVDGGEL